MKWLVIAFLLATATLIVLTLSRDLTSRERRSFEAAVEEYFPQSGNESRTLPIPGDVSVRLPGGTLQRLSLHTDHEVKPGTMVRVSEMVAPWGAVWYRLTTE